MRATGRLASREMARPRVPAPTEATTEIAATASAVEASPAPESSTSPGSTPPRNSIKTTTGSVAARPFAALSRPAAIVPATISAPESWVVSSASRLFRSRSEAIAGATDPTTSSIAMPACATAARPNATRANQAASGTEVRSQPHSSQTYPRPCIAGPISGSCPSALHCTHVTCNRRERLRSASPTPERSISGSRALCRTVSGCAPVPKSRRCPFASTRAAKPHSPTPWCRPASSRAPSRGASGPGPVTVPPGPAPRPRSPAARSPPVARAGAPARAAADGPDPSRRSSAQLPGDCRGDPGPAHEPRPRRGQPSSGSSRFVGSRPVFPGRPPGPLRPGARKQAVEIHLLRGARPSSSAYTVMSSSTPQPAEQWSTARGPADLRGRAPRPRGSSGLQPRSRVLPAGSSRRA
jgi:hypothetical protein